ncbi:MAG: hypothetical protein M3Z03_05625 [Actinomycetota bacterium]|nr:hypothetical protein [Actinomycetota bacterium]
MTELRRRLDEVLFGPGTGSRLLIVHTGLAALIGIRIVCSPFRAFSGTPDALWEPVPVLAVLHSAPSTAAIVALQVIGGAAALAAVLRRHPRVTFAVAWLCFVVLAGIRGSRGKVLHNDLLLLWVAVPFLLAPVRVALSDRTPRRDHGWPVRSAIAIAALIYCFAGYHKVRRAGLDWAIGDNVRYVLLWGPAVGQATWEGLARWVAEHDWAARATGASVLALELSFPLALVRHRLQPLYAAGAVGLHVATYLLLGLDYWTWAATVVLLFIDWGAVAARWSERRDRARHRRRSGVGCSPVTATPGTRTEAP